MLRDVAEVLAPLAEATELLTTETLPAAGCMYYLLYELIGTDLAVRTRPEATAGGAEVDSAADVDEGDDEENQETEEMAPEEEYDSNLAAKLKRCIATKLKERFGLDDHGQPDMDLCRTCPLLVASFCDPRSLF